jgi:beta-phosphoglucomutase-like phosphatase (HAD superfamily)
MCSFPHFKLWTVVAPWLMAVHVWIYIRVSVHAALERMGLSRYFQATVVAEDGMETRSERLLSAAIKLARPPDHCVVFESSPLGITAAHNCTMRASSLRLEFLLL